ncbi:hypothetical protein [Kitasatospora sp. NPDC007106]|uniref:hypothetical protein n=1 Tax=Kitasatospora sp. NPDC007106 TaxID=3156914 RepID=UPI0033C744FE
MTLRARSAAVLGAALLLPLGCAGPGRTEAAPSGRYTGGGVTVELRLDAAGASPRLLRATFTPQEPGFHLYSVDLPDGGVSGLGIPTRLGLNGSLAAAGAPTADRPLLTVSPSGLGVALPVYPDGPVTLTVPVRGTGTGPAGAVISYGACSAQRCLVPVVRQVVPLDPS